MMSVDTSALVAIAIGEAHAPRLRGALESEADIVIAAPILGELAHVLRVKGVGPDKIDAYVADICAAPGIRVLDFTREHAMVSIDAMRRYRRGKKGLNLLDSMAYAVAVVEKRPLLYIGHDFGRTDAPLHPMSVASP